jgi:hypothetical protein
MYFADEQRCEARVLGLLGLALLLSLKFPAATTDGRISVLHGPAASVFSARRDFSFALKPLAPLADCFREGNSFSAALAHLADRFAFQRIQHCASLLTTSYDTWETKTLGRSAADYCYRSVPPAGYCRRATGDHERKTRR